MEGRRTSKVAQHGAIAEEEDEYEHDNEEHKVLFVFSLFFYYLSYIIVFLKFVREK